MIRKMKLLAVSLLLLTFNLFGQKNSSAGLNLSIWKNVSTQKNLPGRKAYLNLGVLTYMNELRGIGLNVIGSRTYGNMYGVQLSGIVNQATLDGYGLQLSGISNITAGNFMGIGFTGLFNLMVGESKGITVAGLSNVNGYSHYGLNLAGLVNVTGQKGVGLDISGLGNVSAVEHHGVMLAGLSNVTGQSIYGVQIAGLTNINAEDMHGVQISPFNVTVGGKGLQLGLVNYYVEDFKGFQLGLVNANPSTKVQWVVYGGSSTKINMAARFKNNLFYTILGLGTHYLDFGHKFSGALFYRAGLGFPIYKKFSLSGDLGYQHIENFKNKHDGFPKRLYALEGRVNLEYRLKDNLALFATSGLSHSRHYNKSQMYKNRAIVEAGIILF